MRSLFLALNDFTTTTVCRRIISIGLLVYSYMLITEQVFIFQTSAIGSMAISEKTILMLLGSFSALAVLLFLKELKILYFLLASIVYTLSTLSPLISGIDTALYFYVLMLFSLPETNRSIVQNRIFLSFSLSWIYFFSSLTKIMATEWRSGLYLFNLSTSGILYQYASYWFFSSPIISKISCYSVILLEFCAPVLLWKKEVRYNSNLVFVLFHFIMLITLKIPHLSILMIACHLYLNTKDTAQ